MSDFELRINVYTSSRSGHANVSFYEDGEHVYTIGANVLLESYKLALPQMIPFQPDDGIYRDETAYHEQALLEGSVISRPLPVTEDTWRDLLDHATALENETYNYSLFSEACTDLVSEFYAASGHPGAFGDLFAPDEFGGALVWMRVPVTMKAPDAGTPPYAPSEPPPDGPTGHEVDASIRSDEAIIVAATFQPILASDHDPTVDLGFVGIEPVPDDGAGVQMEPAVLRVDPAEPLTFGTATATSMDNIMAADTFVFGDPAINGMSEPLERSRPAHDRESADAPPFEWVGLRDDDEDDGASLVDNPSSPTVIGQSPDVRAEPLSFGSTAADRQPEVFDFASDTALSFGLPEPYLVDVAALPLSFGTVGDGPLENDHDEPQKTAFWDDFWPF